MSRLGDGAAASARAGSESQPWIEKYRPSSLDEVAAHTEIVSTSEELAPQIRAAAHWGQTPTEASPPPTDATLLSTVPAVKRFMKEDRLPHLLFYGPPGTGKTSTILALAREMYGKSVSNMVLELNASDDRGINVVRQEIQDFASTMLMVHTPAAPCHAGHASLCPAPL